MVYKAIEIFQRKYRVNCLVIHSKDWALAAGTLTQKIKDGLIAGVTMANTRFRLGDDITINDYFETHNLPVNVEAQGFSEEIMKQKHVFCIPSNVVQEAVATVGLGDSFVGGFLSVYNE
jgi:ADP-dependent phosphofructokinase/glucokinase